MRDFTPVEPQRSGRPSQAAIELGHTLAVGSSPEHDDVATSETMASGGVGLAEGSAAHAQTLAPEQSAAAAPVVVRAGRAGQDSDLPLATIEPLRYGVGGELARGGMGRIVTARDRRLWRNVAIKELLTSTGELRARFERETRITARLQHPSIVNLLDAATWPGGEPFYAMKLVSGESLDKVIAKRASVEERLGLVPNVIAVADALAYAHSLRIIHRDLKPANVLVGEFGETVVIDWGLAKDLTNPEPADVEVGPYRSPPSSPDQTELGAVMGTPAYMPPEQAEGSNVDERADVYALGAMLYHVLAGAPPYSGKTAAAILDAVTAGPPPELATRVTGVPAELVTIVNKAMEHDAAARYPTAKELVDDLKKFQTGQLVGAHRYSAWQLFRRWLHRHRAAVAVASVAMVLLATVGVISVRRILAEQARTLQSRRDAEGLMTFMLGDLKAKLKAVNKVQLLDDVATKAIAYYDQKGTELGDSDLAFAVGARINLGNVLDDRGKTDDARAQYQKALEISRRLVAHDPTSASYQRRLAMSTHSIANMDAKQGKVEAALAGFRTALATIEPLAAKAPGDLQLQDDLTVIHQRIGEVLQRTDPKPALEHFQAIVQLKNAQIARDPNDVQTQTELAVAHVSVATTLDLLGKRDDAVGEYRNGIAIEEALVEKVPDNAELKQNLMQFEANLGRHFAEGMDGKNALAEDRKAIAIAKELSAGDPSNSRHRYALWVYQIGAASALDLQGDTEGSLAETQAALEAISALVASDPKNLGWARNRADTQRGIGETLFTLARYDEAGSAFQRSLDMMTPLLAAEPSNIGNLSISAHAHEGRAKVWNAQKDTKHALAEYQAFREMASRIAKTAPDNVGLQIDLANADVEVATALLALDRNPEALDELRAAQSISEAAATKDPSSFDNQYIRQTVHELVGKILLDQRDARGALPELEASLQLATSIDAAPHPAEVPTKLTIATDHQLTGDAYVALADVPHATAEYNAALATAEPLAGDRVSGAEATALVTSVNKKLDACCGKHAKTPAKTKRRQKTR